MVSLCCTGVCLSPTRRSISTGFFPLGDKEITGKLHTHTHTHTYTYTVGEGVESVLAASSGIGMDPFGIFPLKYEAVTVVSISEHIGPS